MPVKINRAIYCKSAFRASVQFTEMQD